MLCLLDHLNIDTEELVQIRAQTVADRAGIIGEGKRDIYRDPHPLWGGR
jgi:hypothetical protein